MAAGSDPFLTELYDRLHETAMQRKLRRIAPIPVGCVFIERPGMSEGDIRGQFRLMRRLGFTCLKGLYLAEGRDHRRIAHLALDEGIIPWWYDEGGWEAVTDGLLDRLGIPRDTPIEQIRQDERFLAHQMQVMRDRVDAQHGGTEIQSAALPEIPFSFDGELAEGAVPHFVEWLRDQYGAVEGLAEAWNMHHTLIPRPEPMWRTWDDVREGVLELLGKSAKEYRRIRDVLRFKADVHLRSVRARRDATLARDPHAPMRAGGEMGLFLPFAARATDMEGIAEAMAEGGSFYPSIHLAWHFEEVDFEVARPVYMQAQLAQDWFKGGWAATWESTGGPQQLSGGKGHLFPAAAPKTAGFTVDGGVMRILMLSYLAAGFKGFGLWAWNCRTAGWEAGECGLLDRQARPTDRAVEAGRIGQAARRCRDELWQAHKEPLVGVLYDWDNEAIWAAIATGGRDHFRHAPMQARVGASRALINANVPWGHVTGSDLRRGLAPRYEVIYLPAIIALHSELLEILAEFVQQGGRLVLDMPGAWYDEFGRLLPTGQGTAFEQTFGCTIRDFQYSSNVPRSLDGRRLGGFVIDLEPTTARPIARFDTGQPAITEAAVGEGASVVLGYEASRSCYRPGNTAAEALLVRHTLGGHESPYACEGAIVYRLAAPAADHYFVVNDGPARSVMLDTKTYAYRAAVDAITQEPAEPGGPIALEAYSARWLRLEKGPAS